jgi:GMP synthase-like glutamine amidotransferase
MDRKKRKFAVLDCEDSEKWKDLVSIWTQTFKNSDEDIWEGFKVCQGELPSAPEEYHGILISGSHHTSYEPHDWKEQLYQFIRDIHSKPNRPKIIAGCFGCQAVAMALGGKVYKNPSGRFIFGSELIQGTKEFSNKPYVKAILGENPMCNFRILQSHGDCVISLPDRSDVQLLAKSSSCDIEMYSVGQNTIAFQCHPELTVDHCIRRIYPSLIQAKLVQPEDAESVHKTLDDQLLIQILKNFLHSE